MKNHTQRIDPISPAAPALEWRGRRDLTPVRGFSLLEVMAVVAIIGIIFILGGGEISRAWKRQKLQSAATDVKVIFQRGWAEVQRQGFPVFVKVGPLVTSGAAKWLPIVLVGDANRDGVLAACYKNPPTVACPDLLIDEYDIVVKGLTGTKGTTGVDQEFALSDLDVAQVQSALWSSNVTAWTTPRILMCDLQGRAIDTLTGRQIAGPALLVMTHVDVVNGFFTPPTRFVFSINPVWSVRVVKQIKDSTNTWVDKNG